MKEVKSNGTLNKIFEYKFNERGKIQWDTKQKLNIQIRERGKIQWEIKIKYHKNTI